MITMMMMAPPAATASSATLLQLEDRAVIRAHASLARMLTCAVRVSTGKSAKSGVQAVSAVEAFGRKPKRPTAAAVGAHHELLKQSIAEQVPAR
jgi:hypothetical protein